MLLKKIDYNKLTNKALLGVVRHILEIIAKDGFYKKQHLYITFATHHPGVEISDFLREEFEDEMSIVLQYEFWDLVIDDFGFSVNLAFEHGDEAIYIPFSSIVSVSDPSEDFCLEFIPDFHQQRKQNKLNKSESQSSRTNNVISLDIFRK